MVTDQNGIAFLTSLESPNGFSPTWYPDAGSKSIGFGHLYVPGVDNFDVITEEQAYELLRQDLKIAEKKINDAIKVPLNQNQFNALVSFAYNTGRKTSNLYGLINAKKDITTIGNWWQNNYVTSNGIYLPGLKKRRFLEFQLFSKPDSNVIASDSKIIAFVIVLASIYYLAS